MPLLPAYRTLFFGCCVGGYLRSEHLDNGYNFDYNVVRCSGDVAA